VSDGDTDEDLEAVAPSVPARTGSGDIPFFRISVGLALVLAAAALLLSAVSDHRQTRIRQTELCLQEAQTSAFSFGSSGFQSSADRQRQQDSYQRAVRHCLHQPEPPPTSSTTSSTSVFPTTSGSSP
jgi:hypothetical protein